MSRADRYFLSVLIEKLTDNVGTYSSPELQEVAELAKTYIERLRNDRD